MNYSTVYNIIQNYLEHGYTNRFANFKEKKALLAFKEECRLRRERRDKEHALRDKGQAKLLGKRSRPEDHADVDDICELSRQDHQTNTFQRQQCPLMFMVSQERGDATTGSKEVHSLSSNKLTARNKSFYEKTPWQNAITELTFSNMEQQVEITEFRLTKPVNTTSRSSRQVNLMEQLCQFGDLKKELDARDRKLPKV